jgi:hypothetical protein
VIDKFGKKYKTSVVAYFKVLSQNFHGEAVLNRGKPVSFRPGAGPPEYEAGMLTT